MEILLLLGLGFLLLCFGKKPGKDSGKTEGTGMGKALSTKEKKKKGEEEFWDMMMALDDEDELEGF